MSLSDKIAERQFNEWLNFPKGEGVIIRTETYPTTKPYKLKIKNGIR